MANTFSPEEDARLRALIAERLSAREIAAALASEGFPARTRNAILSRVHRLGLRLDSREARVKRGDEPLKKAHLVQSVRTKPSPSAAQPRVSASPPRPAPVAEPEAKPPAPPPTDRPGIAFLAARDSQCHYPLWAHDARPTAMSLVCGARAKPGSAYCPACHALAYQPRPLPNLARHSASYARHDGALRCAASREHAA